MSTHRSRSLLFATLLVGVGLMVAPFAFQMFHRAPLGGDMITDFEPYMSAEKIDNFRGYMDLVDRAVAESAVLRAQMIDAGSLTAEQYDTQFLFAQQLADEWVVVNADMTDLLDRMDQNMDNYAAVAALPPFALFPWFFVVPGAAIAGLSCVLLWKGRRGPYSRAGLWSLVALGVGLVAAPAVFQMFTRAPAGGQMIDEFRPMMTRERVQAVQGHFVTLGAGEGQLRVGVVAEYVAAGGHATDFPAIEEFSTKWPTIVGEFNPMIATMSDNIDNFEAVDAMPSFPLFPWFFVIPGLLVGGCAMVALRRSPPPTDSEVRP